MIKITNKLYGRDKETAILYDSYKEVCDGKFNIVIVNGNSGTGKTTLVNNLKNMIDESTHFISGKFDKNNENIPYTALIKAYDYFIHQILSKPKDVVDRWKNKIKIALGNNSGIISIFINSLDLLIGEEIRNNKNSISKDKRRFSSTLIKFIQAFPEKDHPAVLFLDDLQWADSASIEALKSLSREYSNNYLMIIATYRSNEIDKNHKINILLNSLKKDNNTKYITLDNLTVDDINNMVADNYTNLNYSFSDLSQIIYKNTLGNPYYISQFLKYINDENYLFYDSSLNTWITDTHQLKKIIVDDNVINLVLKRISRLDNIELLKTASCIGNTFSLKELQLITNEPKDKILEIMNMYIAKGFISVSDEYKGDNTYNVFYEFLHDKIFHAIYMPIPDEHKIRMHFDIGRSLLEHYSGKEIDENIISIMSHINIGFDNIPSENNIYMAELYLKAGKKASQIVAYESASIFFANGKKLIDHIEFDKNYELIFNLNLECAKTEYLCSDKLKAIKMFNFLLKKAKNKNDLSSIHKTKMELHLLEGNYDDSIKEGIKALGYLGHKLIRTPTRLDLLKSLISSCLRYSNSNLKKITNIKDINSNKENAVIELLMMLSTAAFQTESHLFTLIALQLGALSIKETNPKYASLGCIGYVVFEIFMFGNQKKSELLRNTAHILCEKSKDDSAVCLVNFFNAIFINHWTSPAKKSLEYYQNCIKYGINSGDHVYASFSTCAQIEFEFYIGTNINTICNKSNEATNVIQKLNSNIGLNFMLHFINAIEGIRKNNMDFFYNKQIEKSIAEVKIDYATYLLTKIKAFYIYENYKELLATLEKSLKYIHLTTSLIQNTEFAFLNSLVITALYSHLSKKQRVKYIKILKRNLSSMKKWADRCPENFMHKYYLMSAEKCRIDKKNGSAMLFFDKAIKSADENGYIQNSAIANELAGKYYKELDNQRIAKMYFVEAYNKYLAWGATGKADLLKTTHSLFIKKELEHIDNKDKLQMGNQYKDKILKVTNAYKNILSQKNDNEQLKVLLSKVIDITQAQKAYLLIEKDEEMYVVYYKDKEMTDIKQVNEISLSKTTNLPKSIIRYTERTFDAINSDAIKKENDVVYSIILSDNYLKKTKPYAFTSVPIIISDGFLGTIYLENTDKEEPFAMQDIDIIRMLSQLIKIITSKNETNIKLAASLSKREIQVLKLIAKGLSNKDIAEELYISVTTVNTHVKKTFTKLGINKRVQATSIAISLGYQS